MKAALALAVFLGCALTTSSAFAWNLMGERTGLFEKRSYQSTSGKAAFDYYLLKPLNYDPHRYSYPLVLTLPGASGDSFGAYVLADQNMRAYQAFVLVPHARVAGWTVAVLDDQRPEPSAHLVTIIEQLKREFAIDDRRVYVTGYAEGGFGTFGIVAQYPHYFAAAAPLGGGGEKHDAKTMVDTPMWVFHGALDQTPVKRSRDMVAAIKQAGGHPLYTEYPDVRHDVWTRAYMDPKFWNWLFSQRRTEAPSLPPPPANDDQADQDENQGAGLIENQIPKELRDQMPKERLDQMIRQQMQKQGQSAGGG